MVKSASLSAALALDSGFRQAVLPLGLLAASLFRYTIPSLLYFMCMLVSVYLPDSSKKKDRIPSLVLTILLALLSLFMTLAQPLFQISMATDYDDELEQCSTDEKIWRQFGFIVFNVRASDVLRNYLPDIIVLALSIISGVFLLLVHIVEKKSQQQAKAAKCSSVVDQSLGGGNASPRDHSNSPVGDTNTNLISSGVMPSSEPNILHRLESNELEKLSPETVIEEFGTKIEGKVAAKQQKRTSFYKLPIFFLLSVSWKSFYIVFLWFSGICVACVLNFVYFACSIYLSLGWALHLNQTRVFSITRKVLMVVVSLFSAVHLILLYLYQFQSAQEHVSRSSVTARVLGFTGIVRTDCNRTTELLTHTSLEWPIYVNPISLFIVFWMSTSELRLYLFQAKSKSRKSHRSKHHKQKPGDHRSTKKGIASVGDDEADDDNGDDTNGKKQKKHIVWTAEDSRKILESMYAGMKWLLTSFLEVNFVFSLIAMMVWSVVFPSWTSFVFLIWSCVVWVTPKFNAKDVVYYTTPVLVLYAIVLLLIQYLYNLDLTEGELESNIYAGLTRYNSPPGPDGVRVLAIGIKSLCTAVFLSSLFEFILLHKNRWYAFLQRHCSASDDVALETGVTGVPDDNTSPTEPVTDQPDTEETSLIATALRTVAMPTDPYKYLKKYWIIVTTGAFLLVILVGEVTLFKVVFMIFFLLFIFAYEFFPHNWYRIMEPLWTILIFYAFIELTAIYTYQFSYVRDVWIEALNSSHNHLSVDEILESIGFFQVAIDTLSFRSIKDLFITIVPSAVFVAVMALQLKYFSPYDSRDNDNQRNRFRDLGQAEHRRLSFVQSADHPSKVERSQRQEEGEDITPVQDVTDLTTASPKEDVNKQHMQEMIEKYWTRLKTAFYLVNEFLWRLLEIYLPKVIIFVIFAVLLDEISATHFLVLAILVVTIPVDVNPVMYLILTGIISNLTLLKMLYQLALVDRDTFNFSKPCPNDTNNIPPPRGAIFKYEYTRDDPGWLGFQKVECDDCKGFIDYIRWDIVVLLLIALSYVVSRRQSRYFRDVQIPVADKRALFWGITLEDADRSVLHGLGYLINHIFDFYGLEICWSMFAIAVAIRTDIFGVLYAIALGVFLLTPHKALRPVWLLYLMIHVCLLLVQYAMLVGVPYGACIDDQRGTKTFPWSDIEPVGLKRWLWLPIASNEFFILNRNWLWADLLVYVVMSFQFRNLRRSLNEIDAPDQGFFLNFLTFATSKELADHVKRITYKHFFWVTLFIVLVAGVSQVSVLGLLYMIVSFVLLWQGQTMLRYRRERLRRWWFFLLLIIWSVLLVKVSLQLYTCVYFEKDVNNDCIVVRLFNARCETPSYYGTYNETSNTHLCPNLPNNFGIWLDTFAFIVVVFQIIIFSTSHFDSIRSYLLTRESLDESKRATGDLLDKINKELEKEREKEKIIKESIKKRLLEVQDKYKTSIVEHYLRAGVQLPDNIEFNEDDDEPIDLEHYHSLRRSDIPAQQDEPAGSDDIKIPQDEIVRSKMSKDGSEKEKEKESTFKAIWKLIGNGLSFIDSGFVLVINYLRARSKYYRYLSKKRKQRKDHGEDVELNPMSPQPMEYDTVTKPAATATTTEVILETAEDPSKQPSINSYDAAITDAPVTDAAITADGQVDNVDDDDYLPEVEDGLFKTWYDMSQVWKRFIRRPLQFVIALYYAALANTEYVCYFLIIINVIVNGSILSLSYAALMFLWGLLSIPWPTKRFWLTLMFYTMFVILVKYGFQFEPIDDRPDDEINSGLHWPHILGIERVNDILENTVWDVLLLISLFFHRSLLIDTGRWSVGGDGYFDILSFTRSDGTSAIQLILKPRDELLESLSGKNDSEEKEVDKPSEQEASKSLSEVSSSEEEESSEPGLLSYILKVMLINVKFFYRQIVTPDISLGAHDYYTISFLMDAISFIIIAVGAQSFGLASNEGAGGVATYIQENNIPLTFVATLFAHFLSMVIDRAIYLRKSVLGKLIFFLFQLVAWHVWLFFVLPLPSITATAFTDNGYAQALYFFKCQYFIFSAQQCVSGFPKRVLGYFISKRYNLLASLTFQGYRAIPILPDLKEVMDWMFTDTSLKLFHWLKVQEIWAQLYIIKNLRKREKNDPRVLGQPEGFVIKLLLGGSFLVLLILLIWGPLLLIALANSTNVSNPPVEVSIQLTLGSFVPLLSITAGRDSITQISSSGYDSLSSQFSIASRQRAIFRENFKKEDFKVVKFQGNSTSLWDISPPSRDALQAALNPDTNSNEIRLIFSWQVSREPTTGLVSEMVVGQQRQNLQNSTREGLYNLLNGTTNDSVTLNGLYPPFIYAPANGQSRNLDSVVNLDSLSESVNVSINIQNRTITDENDVQISQEWWILEGISNLNFPVQNSSDVIMVFYSEKVSQPIFSFIAGAGIIGLYLTVVLGIGGALRSYIAALPSKITFNEIPNPDSLLELCDDIFYVREDGNLQQEEILVGRLFFIFRSPARLIQQTKWKRD